MPNLIEALPLITTPLSLVAFLASVAVYVHARAVGRAQKLIRTAPSGDRATLVGGALQILDVRSQDLSREQRFELAVEILGQRRFRSLLAFWSSLLVAVLLGALTAYSFTAENIPKSVDNLLSGENRLAAIGILQERGIFQATDEAMVHYLAEKSVVPEGSVGSLSEAAFIEVAQAQYESIPSIRELRRRAQARSDPFRPLGEKTLATVPDRIDHPRQFLVHVPIASKFSNRPIKITSMATGKYIRVYARSAIDPSNTGTSIHLNREQATFLNGGAFPVAGRLQVIVGETIEPIYDPNCSIPDRLPQFRRVAVELCDQGESVTIPYLQSVLGL
jgi:hypothetical protein